MQRARPVRGDPLPDVQDQCPRRPLGIAEDDPVGREGDRRRRGGGGRPVLGGRRTACCEHRASQARQSRSSLAQAVASAPPVRAPTALRSRTCRRRQPFAVSVSEGGACGTPVSAQRPWSTSSAASQRCLTGPARSMLESMRMCIRCSLASRTGPAVSCRPRRGPRAQPRRRRTPAATAPPGRRRPQHHQPPGPAGACDPTDAVRVRMAASSASAPSSELSEGLPGGRAFVAGGRCGE